MRKIHLAYVRSSTYEDLMKLASDVPDKYLKLQSITIGFESPTSPEEVTDLDQMKTIEAPLGDVGVQVSCLEYKLGSYLHTPPLWGRPGLTGAQAPTPQSCWRTTGGR
jgi:hypothetical protein